ncbi:voltage-gated potassium channel [Saccharicrinis carchari]|uniref:Voltage-gated potassium channel n=1 Tax=Saccharicrinis carchari TaxID=1168039 RepID=A0A521CIV3_SACCC|nr:ion transporter [Saccharicrinis carchari]SMO59379.1 voltage-gated potassium channel [Saccharicrinis carchari]
MREKLFVIIFGADTKPGKAFDLILIVLIIFSITIVMLESLPDKSDVFYYRLNVLEWVVTSIFLVEYIVRIWIVRKPWRYIFSALGIIDLLAIIPSFLGLAFSGTHMLVVLRALRLLRIFRILKLTRYMDEGSQLWRALVASRKKIGVFIFTVVVLIIIMGTMMYIIESNQESGFTSIPISIYWSVVTLTTVGYGDIAPVTALGQTLASIVMIMGYAIIAVPTGIVTVELGRKPCAEIIHPACSFCGKKGHDKDAVFCKYCGKKLG